MRRIPRLAFVVLVLSLHAGVVSQAEDGGARARVATREEGFLRVTAARLAALGLAPASEVAVSRRGRPVPAFASGDDLVFLSVHPGTDASAVAVYELERVPDGRGKVISAAAPEDTPEAKGLHATRVVDRDRVYGEVAAAELDVYGPEDPLPVWYLALVPLRGKAELPLDPAGAEAGAAQRLVAKVVGTHTGPVALSASWGGRDLGKAEAASAAGGATLAWDVPADAVPPNQVPLVLTDASPLPPPPAAHDVSDDRGAIWIDEVALEGPIAAEVGERLLRVRAPAGPTAFRAPGTGPVFAAARGQDGAPLPRVPVKRVEGRVVLPALPAGSELLLSARAVDVEPTPAPPRADPLATAGAAEHVILATNDLLADARRLAEHRTRGGLPSAVVPVSEVYDAYAVGEQDGQAVRDFLLALMARESAPLRFVVLAGDATLDRTDLAPIETIPARMSRTKYNGATPADRFYGRPAGDEVLVGGASVGRLPFRTAEEMKAYVDRVIEYETRPPASDTRRMMRFVTGEGHFGAALDAMIESYTGKILSNHIPKAYDVEVTYARADSPFSWPAVEFGQKVVDGLNAGALVYSYIGHGHPQGFDSVWVGEKRFPILSVKEAPQIEVKGTLPAVIVLACSTGAFDYPQREGIGEALLKRPRGPIAYFGATRICHPAVNGVLGRSICLRVFEDPERRRIGEILDKARDEMLEPSEADPERMLILGAMRLFAPGEDMTRILEEGSYMYGLLGDPAVPLAMPASDLEVAATVDGRQVKARVGGSLPDGTAVAVSVEVPRNEMVGTPTPVADPLDPASAEAIRENHRRANDKRVASGEAKAKGGVAEVVLTIPEGVRSGPLVVKASAVSSGTPRVGAATVELP